MARLRVFAGFVSRLSHSTDFIIFREYTVIDYAFTFHSTVASVTFTRPRCRAFLKVEVRDLPRISAIEEQSVAVKGSGHCTIRDVSLADASAEESTDPAVSTYIYFKRAVG